MDSQPTPPPEGSLLASAAQHCGLSIREAARRADISYGRWRQIVTGYQNVSPGSYAPVRAPAKTLARMAAVVDVGPEELEQAGRADAADELRSLISSHRATRSQGSGASADGVSAEIPPGVADAIASLAETLVPVIETEVRRARMRDPDATGREIFGDEFEARVWDIYGEEFRNAGIDQVDETTPLATIALLRANRQARRSRDQRPEYPKSV